MDPGGAGDPAEADWKRAWLVDFGKVVVIAVAAVVGLIVLVVFIYGQFPHGELGTAQIDIYSENVGVTADHPLGIRVLAATLDPGGTAIDAIPVHLNLSSNRSRDEMWIAAIRLDEGRPTFLEESSPGVFNDEFAASCLNAACARFYVLVACWREPTTESRATVYYGGSLSAVRDAGTPSAHVALDVTGDRLTGEVAAAITQASGCHFRL